jgi:hypothetical protein
MVEMMTYLEDLQIGKEKKGYGRGYGRGSEQKR